MPQSQYLSPGVYVEEEASAARPIAGVGTSTAGFIGVVDDKPEMPPQPGKFDDKKAGVPYTIADAGVPQLITSWEEFKNSFGDIQAKNSPLSQAVYGFFNNGGTRCWVIRVATAEAPKADSKQAGAGGWTNLAPLLDKFAGIDEIAIVAAPGATAKAQQDALLSHCENAKDRVAILDSAQTPANNDPGAIKSSGTGAAKDSTYGALYYPWIKVLDPSSGNNISQPPSGHIAGIYARVDATRGVHKAPANEVIRGALDLEKRLSRADQDGLNPSGINAIRAFDGTIKVFGARTLGGDNNQDFKYISTRRFFNFMRESIDHGTQWVVFEPNTPALWQSITRNVTAFLTGVWRSGALFGVTAQEAFYVKCDADTNPPDQRELGMVVTEIGVSIVRPAEFVIFRVSQWAGPGK